MKCFCYFYLSRCPGTCRRVELCRPWLARRTRRSGGCKGTGWCSAGWTWRCLQINNYLNICGKQTNGMCDIVCSKCSNDGSCLFRGLSLIRLSSSLFFFFSPPLFLPLNELFQIQLTLAWLVGLQKTTWGRKKKKCASWSPLKSLFLRPPKPQFLRSLLACIGGGEVKRVRRARRGRKRYCISWIRALGAWSPVTAVAQRHNLGKSILPILVQHSNGRKKDCFFLKKSFAFWENNCYTHLVCRRPSSPGSIRPCARRPGLRRRRTAAGPIGCRGRRLRREKKEIVIKHYSGRIV